MVSSSLINADWDYAHGDSHLKIPWTRCVHWFIEEWMYQLNHQPLHHRCSRFHPMGGPAFDLCVHITDCDPPSLSHYLVNWHSKDVPWTCWQCHSQQPSEGLVGATGLSTVRFVQLDHRKQDTPNSGRAGLDTANSEQILSIKTQDNESFGSETAWYYGSAYSPVRYYIGWSG
jgi:hypothetical protein